MNEVMEVEEQAYADLPHVETSTSALVLDVVAFDRIMVVAQVMSQGRATIPKHLQGNQADCMAVVMQSMQWQMNPFAVAQKTHLINGVLGYEAQLVNAVIINRAPVVGRMFYEWFGPWEKVIGRVREMESKDKFEEDGKTKKKYRMPDWSLADEEGIGIKVWNTIKGESAPRELTLLLKQARVRNSPLWADDPKQQLAYLAVKRWSRLYTPDVILGVYTPDELEDARPERDITPPRTPAEIGAAALPKASETADRDQLIKDLEFIAVKRDLEALRNAWQGLTKEERALVGMDEMNRLKGIADSVPVSDDASSHEQQGDQQ